MSDSTDDVNNDLNDSGNVLSLEKAKANKKAKKSGTSESNKPDKDDRLKFSTVERDLCALIEGVKMPLLSNMPDFPYHFENIRRRPTDGSVQILIDGNSATLVNAEFIAGKLRDYTQFLTDKQADYALSTARCLEVAKAWAMRFVHRKTLPKTVGFLSDPELCLHRLSFDYSPVDIETLKMKAPIFAGYLSRMTNSNAFCMRIGSIFDQHAHRKQILWVQGEQNCGKSPLGRILCLLVGESFALISEETLEEKFWKESFVGKRLAIFNEIRPRFFRTPGFKTLTGDVMHQVRPFGGKAFLTNLEPICVCLTNDSPEVQNQAPITDRIIHCVIQPIPSKDRISESELMERVIPEIPYIVNYCYGKWLPHPPGIDIPNDSEGAASLKKAVEDYEGPYLDFIANYFDIGDKFYAEIDHVRRLMFYVADFRSNAEQSICKRVILSQSGITQSRKTFAEGRRVNCYLGLRIKPKYRNLLRVEHNA